MRGGGRRRNGLLGLAAALALSGCDMMQGPLALSPTPPPRPAALTAPPPAEPSDSPIAAHFARLEADRLARGLLRIDGGGPDTPFTAAMLEENFVRIALYDEYTRVGGRLVERATPNRLRRFEAPVRIELEFGASVPTDRRAADTEFVSRYATRLSRITGHSIGVVPTGSGSNFHVLVLAESERRAAGDRLRQLLPGIDDASLRLVTDLPLSISCLALAVSAPGGGVYRNAVAVIRAELPDLSRQSCYHEEIAQGLGLPNDSPRARPSLFNDTQEFAFLTTHDEQLLQILYDPRLRPGMREAEARPIARTIIAGLMGPQT